MTLSRRRTMYRVRNTVHGFVHLLGFALVLGAIAGITLLAHAILGR